MSDTQLSFQRFQTNFGNIINSSAGATKLEADCFVVEVASGDALERLTMLLPDEFEGHPVVVYDPSTEAEGEA